MGSVATIPQKEEVTVGVVSSKFLVFREPIHTCFLFSDKIRYTALHEVFFIQRFDCVAKSMQDSSSCLYHLQKQYLNMNAMGLFLKFNVQEFLLLPILLKVAKEIARKNLFNSFQSLRVPQQNLKLNFSS